MSDDTDRAREMAEGIIVAISNALAGAPWTLAKDAMIEAVMPIIAPLLAARAQAERERDAVRAEFADWKEDSFRDMADGEIALFAAEARAEGLRKALEPFAEAAKRWDTPPSIVIHDDVQLWQQGWRVDYLTVGDLRRAREALAADQAGGEDADAEAAKAALAEYELDGGISLDDLKAELASPPQPATAGAPIAIKKPSIVFEFEDDDPRPFARPGRAGAGAGDLAETGPQVHG